MPPRRDRVIPRRRHRIVIAPPIRRAGFDNRGRSKGAAAVGSPHLTGRDYAVGQVDLESVSMNSVRFLIGVGLAGSTLAIRVRAQTCEPAWHEMTWGANEVVRSVLEHDADGPGPLPSRLYATGGFTQVGNTPTNGIASWDGTQWDVLGGGLTGGFGGAALASVPDPLAPGGNALVVGGKFSQAGTRACNNIASWNGTAWSPLGPGITGGDGVVASLVVFDEDGAGPMKPALFVGGRFSQAGFVAANNIARWDGTSWSAVGGGVNGWVEALIAYDDDGEGPHPPALYATGGFSQAGSTIVGGIARWDGATWTRLGTGLSGSFVPSYSLGYALAVFDEDGVGGNPPALFVGGTFSQAGNQLARGIARWNGTAWFPVGGAASDLILTMDVFDDDGDGPSPPRLYAGGDFVQIATTPANRIACWDGLAWHPVGMGVNGRVETLAAYRLEAAPPALAVGGSFTAVEGRALSRVASWGAPCSPHLGDADGDCDVDQDDLDIVLFNYGRTVMPGSDGDLDRNAIVNQDDLDLVLFYYGTRCL